MAWDPALNTGVEEIDKQHMTLVAELEKFSEAITAQEGSSVLNSTLGFLESYVIDHFATEEEMHRNTNYPDFQHHKQIHEELIQGLNELTGRIDEEGLTPEIANQTYRFLLNWAVEHISGEDMKFGAYYRSL